MKAISIFAVATTFALSACGNLGSSPSAYQGQESRDIKALSKSEISDLLAGKGMGLAKPAELNGYPGPMHVLELSRQLNLSTEQQQKTQEIFQLMSSDAKRFGVELIDAERQLDTLFASRQVNPESLSQALNRVALAQSKVRNAHLHAHLEQTKILTAEQITQYAFQRGYTIAPLR